MLLGVLVNFLQSFLCLTRYTVSYIYSLYYFLLYKYFLEKPSKINYEKTRIYRHWIGFGPLAITNRISTVPGYGHLERRIFYEQWVFKQLYLSSTASIFSPAIRSKWRIHAGKSEFLRKRLFCGRTGPDSEKWYRGTCKSSSRQAA